MEEFIPLFSFQRDGRIRIDGRRLMGDDPGLDGYQVICMHSHTLHPIQLEVYLGQNVASKNETKDKRSLTLLPVLLLLLLLLITIIKHLNGYANQPTHWSAAVYISSQSSVLLPEVNIHVDLNLDHLQLYT